ncbi:sigma-E factor negative regulatory protein [Shewanella salipaludis]|uniref:Anti-sigma-E factor RseA n=1 Tax=Shewanella salipaludis TaxID=2723052 RepID=A0A972FT84_9GAMM|nr:RseA family anti-sigma factor [Shewanella salipaludis]NMH64789.1 anti-sigma factor [Shewanella salipaludis]
MDKLNPEWVSAAVDDETDAQTLAALSADTHSHGQWQKYHLIGDAMRGELPQTIDLDFAARVAAAIESEPALVASEPEVATQAAQSKVVPFFTQSLKQFGQYAIAASVALVAIVGVQNYSQDADNGQSLSPVLVTRPLVGSASPVSFQTGAVKQPQGYTNEQVIEQRRRINAYIQDHMLQQRLNTGVVIDDNSEDTPVSVNQ